MHNATQNTLSSLNKHDISLKTYYRLKGIQIIIMSLIRGTATVAKEGIKQQYYPMSPRNAQISFLVLGTG